ncbi:MAG: toll/interleukin-1 receptor domain-containing protein, partial [Ilumatobacteraceae bacterium]
MVSEQPSIFISYAHEDAALAHDLARALEGQGARVWLDQGELLIGDSLIGRISEAIAEFDFVAALVSEHSVASNWCQKEIALAMSKQLVRGNRTVTVLPLRVGTVAMPPSLRDVKWLQLDGRQLDRCAAHVVGDASRHLARNSTPIVAARASTPINPHPGLHEPVRILGVDSEHVGAPRNDGTRGSGLYRVPLILSRVPDKVWRETFEQAWNSPPAWTTMHRPGIASLQGDRIVLDGTTIEELEKYHLQTLKLVIHQLNELAAKDRITERARIEAEAAAAAAHARRVEEIA